MCGIIAVLRRPVERTDLTAGPIVERLDQAVSLLRSAVDEPLPATMNEAATAMEAVSTSLHGPRGVRLLLTDLADRKSVV